MGAAIIRLAFVWRNFRLNGIRGYSIILALARDA